jgi:hypothetical protein
LETGKRLVETTCRGTRNWTKSELVYNPNYIAELKKNARVKVYEGDHINSVGTYPDQPVDPNNFLLLRGRRHKIGKMSSGHIWRKITKIRTVAN